MEKVEELKMRVKTCEKCPLYIDYPCPQFGFGSKNPKIMIVVPNSEEGNALCGIPVGAEDNIVLERSIKNSGLKNTDVYITPLLKCGKLIGNTKNAKICRSWLLDEIEILKPATIIFMGASIKKFYEMDYSIEKKFFEKSPYSLFYLGDKYNNDFIEILREIKNCLVLKGLWQ